MFVASSHISMANRPVRTDTITHTGKADVTVKIKDADFMDLVSGKLTPQKVGSVYNLYCVK